MNEDYYILWCTDFYDAFIGIVKTRDFKTFARVENPFIPRCVLPKKDRRHVLAFVPHFGQRHMSFGGIFNLENSDLTYWDRHRCVYSIGEVVLEINEPRHVKFRCWNFLWL